LKVIKVAYIHYNWWNCNIKEMVVFLIPLPWFLDAIVPLLGKTSSKHFHSFPRLMSRCASRVSIHPGRFAECLCCARGWGCLREQERQKYLPS
jgi:hypothetical protein